MRPGGLGSHLAAKAEMPSFLSRNPARRPSAPPDRLCLCLLGPSRFGILYGGHGQLLLCQVGRRRGPQGARAQASGAPSPTLPAPSLPILLRPPQFIQCLVLCGWVGLTMGAFFSLLAALKRLRVPVDQELAGLDMESKVPWRPVTTASPPPSPLRAAASPSHHCARRHAPRRVPGAHTHPGLLPPPPYYTHTPHSTTSLATMSRVAHPLLPSPRVPPRMVAYPTASLR
jgi:hypothetical protein